MQNLKLDGVRESPTSTQIFLFNKDFKPTFAFKTRIFKLKVKIEIRRNYQDTSFLLLKLFK